MADAIATVADVIATLVMTDVIVIVEMTILCNSWYYTVAEGTVTLYEWLMLLPLWQMVLPLIIDK